MTDYIPFVGGDLLMRGFFDEKPELKGRCEARIVEKGWGREIIFADFNLYAGKILEFDPGTIMSVHFHLEKHETWYVLAGELTVCYFDTEAGAELRESLKPGDVWCNPQGFPHRLINDGQEFARILEVSTRDDPEDNYRIAPGNSQIPGSRSNG